MQQPQTGDSGTPDDAPGPARGSRFWGFYGRAVGWLAPLLVALWIGGTIASVVLIPPLSPTGSREEFAGAVSAGAQAIQAQKQALQKFGYPLIAQNVVVQYRSGGLPLSAQAKTVTTAVRLDRGQLPGLKGIAAAVPVTNTLKLAPASSEAGTTALTYLFFEPSYKPQTTTRLSEEYARRYLSAPGDGFVGVTGAYPAEAAQGDKISGSLHIVEYASIVILLIVVGLTFRSVVAPLLTLFTAGMTYILSERILSWATTGIGISVPNELDPVIVVLLFGIVTDYAVFYHSALRRRLAGASSSGKDAVRDTIVEVTPLVLVASFTVALGVALITAARLPLFSSLGPGLAISVAVVVAAATTFLPAALSLLRTVSLWPSAHRPSRGVKGRKRIQYALTKKWVSVPVIAICVAGLVYLGINVEGIKLGTNLVTDLPASSSVVKASDAAARGFAPGVVAPTQVLVQSDGSSASVASFSTLQTELAAIPGVRGVIGPADIPSFLDVKNVFVSNHHDAARYLVVFGAQPLSAAGVEDLRRVQDEVPALMQRLGLTRFSASYAGDTAITQDVVGPARNDILYVGLYVAAADLIMAILLLRSLLGPVVLTLASILVVAASIALTSFVFPATSTSRGFTFYVPFACAVLLLSFGADYNLFVSGEIWENARVRRFRVAVPEGAARAGSAINTAGITLALTFSALALVPLVPFRQIAFCMGVGLLLDTFVVRFLVVPAVLSLLGRVALWPDLRRDRRWPRGTSRRPIDS